MRIFTELLFHHGHIADVELAQRLAEPDTAVASVDLPESAESTTSAESTKSGASETQGVQPAAATRKHIRREQSMARLSRHLRRAMTALSPFR